MSQKVNLAPYSIYWLSYSKAYALGSTGSRWAIEFGTNGGESRKDIYYEVHPVEETLNLQVNNYLAATPSEERAYKQMSRLIEWWGNNKAKVEEYDKSLKEDKTKKDEWEEWASFVLGATGIEASKIFSTFDAMVEALQVKHRTPFSLKL